MPPFPEESARTIGINIEYVEQAWNACEDMAEIWQGFRAAGKTSTKERGPEKRACVGSASKLQRRSTRRPVDASACTASHNPNQGADEVEAYTTRLIGLWEPATSTVIIH